MKFLNGVRIGEYELDVDRVIDEIREKCIEGRKNYTSIALYRGEELDCETVTSWARFLTDNDIYFHFAFSSSPNVPTPFSPETAREVKRIAGDHFLGILIPELGSTYGCTGKAYGGVSRHHEFELLSQGKQGFIDHINSAIERFGFPDDIGVSVIEATSLVSYVAAANTGIPVLETMCGDVENTVPLLRGSAKAKGGEGYINYVAHEWYAGVDNEDELKKKRLRMVYNYSYMNGARGIILESGDVCMHSHGLNAG